MELLAERGGRQRGNKRRFGRRPSSRWEETRVVSIARLMEIIYTEKGKGNARSRRLVTFK